MEVVAETVDAHVRARVHGKWCYLYRAIDADGNLVDSRLSQKQDMEAAQRFFLQAARTVGHAPERVATDGHGSYPRAIRETLGSQVIHRCIPTSTIDWSRIIGASNNAIIPCEGLDASPRQHASAARLMSSASSSVFAPP